MSFLCTIRNKEVSYNQCINRCQYSFKSACIDKMNEAYNQGRADAIEELVSAIKQNMPYDICDGEEAIDEIVTIAEQLKS